MDEHHDADDGDAVRDRAAGTERGASLVEYALLLALIAVVLIAAVGVFGDSIDTMYSDANDTLNSHVQG